MDKIKILGISGSLRKESFHTKLLKVITKMSVEGAEIETADISNLPLFNQDFETNPPEAVAAFKKKIKESDAILFVSPEYNYSVPGALKNAIDWASRPYGDNSFDGKTAAIISGSIGILGGSRMQYHLRQSFVFLNMRPLNRPEVMIPMIQDKFDASGNITDAPTKEKVEEMINALVSWTKEMKTK